MSRIPKAGSKPQDTLSRVQSFIDEMYKAYIVQKTKHIQHIQSDFNGFFDKERVVSFRAVVPKGLNQTGEAVLKDFKVWMLWILIIVRVKGEPFASVMRVLEAGMKIVEGQGELVDGVDWLLTEFPNTEVTDADEEKFFRLTNRRCANKRADVIGISENREFALVKLPQRESKMLKSPLAITLIENNQWILDAVQLEEIPMKDMLNRSKYTYFPQALGQFYY